MEELDASDASGPAKSSTLTQRGREQVERARSMCERFNFQAAFCSPEAAVEETADIMWEKRGGPPYFRKVRPRATLQGLGGSSGTSATSSPGAEVAAPHWDTSAEGRLLTEAKEFLTEVCTINWSTELTEGLGGVYLDPAKDREDILVVSHASSLAALVAVALRAPETVRALVFDPGSLTILDYSGSGGSIPTAKTELKKSTNPLDRYENGLPGTFKLCSLDLELSK
ncbi:hypothetical protein KFL_004690050 [Klebsormidium nitens]|uniref:Phosphoglycerate mutase family protein n=1 Tax=Klebsormidium nitens TaxID=105231 RepID=A0A1Y1IFT8_KLENI|nr:hypothetical protein KFL_004690050 [Klebsormidium nitens]|eukprot:GAQ88912.1 hypothetical protein KFL_004690050 [Klebsormidium nitens]